MIIKQIASHFAHRNQERLQFDIAVALGFLLLVSIFQNTHLDVMGDLQFMRQHLFLRFQAGVLTLVTRHSTNQQTHHKDA